MTPQELNFRITDNAMEIAFHGLPKNDIQKTLESLDDIKICANALSLTLQSLPRILLIFGIIEENQMSAIERAIEEDLPQTLELCTKYANRLAGNQDEKSAA